MDNNQFLMQSKLIEVKKIISPLVLDIKYATKDNFTKEIIYSNNRCYLLEHVAMALRSASEEFNKLGYTIKIWDGYRPLKAQYIFWKLVPDERYVADPEKGSRHNRGCAIDLTLVDNNGKELDMGTEFDDFTQKADRSFKDLPQEVLKNRKLLQEIMEKNNFIGWENEWWHFDFVDWENNPVLDISFSEIEK
jgi:zinc D-Ala-D-Ala dipeptidase